jgi:transcription initiation factor IIE alpha subunit
VSGAAATDLAHVLGALQRAGALPAHTVYECPECGERLVGQQRCPDCGRFGRAVGLGGTCPDCDAVILLSDVLAEEVTLPE